MCAQPISLGTVIGPYTVVRETPQGAGGMARVYIAQFVLPSGELHSVALKLARTTDAHGNLLNQADMEFYNDALNNEVETLRRLRHPNIVSLYPIPQPNLRRQTPYIARALDQPGQPWYCAMEYLAGGTLEARIRQGRLPLPEALEITYQIALALDYIHSKHFAHLDIKPDNVLFRRPLEANGRLEPVLVDFGISAKLQKTGLQAGAVPYMAPERLRLMRQELPAEQLRDQSPADVYGLGILLYRMLTGHLPFESANRDHLTTAILTAPPTRPSRYKGDIPGEVENLLLRTLAKEPRERPSIDEMTTLIDKAMPPPRLVDANHPPPKGRTPIWRTAVTFGAVGLVTLGIGFGLGRLGNNQETSAAVVPTTVAPPAAPPPVESTPTSIRPPRAVSTDTATPVPPGPTHTAAVTPTLSRATPKP